MCARDQSSKIIPVISHQKLCKQGITDSLFGSYFSDTNLSFRTSQNLEFERGILFKFSNYRKVKLYIATN